MSVKITGELIIETDEPEILFLAIEPENKTLPKESGIIQSEITDKTVSTIISGEMSLGRFINTIDDVFKAALLSLNIQSEIED